MVIREPARSLVRFFFHTTKRSRLHHSHPLIRKNKHVPLNFGPATISDRHLLCRAYPAHTGGCTVSRFCPSIATYDKQASLLVSFPSTIFLPSLQRTPPVCHYGPPSDSPPTESQEAKTKMEYDGHDERKRFIAGRRFSKVRFFIRSVLTMFKAQGVAALVSFFFPKSHLLVEHLGTEDAPLQVHKMDPSRRLPKHDPADVLVIVKKVIFFSLQCIRP